MQAEPDNIYSLRPADALFARELAALDPLLAGIYGQHGLFIHPRSSHPAEPVHLLGNLITLQIAAPQRLAGSLHCTPDQLPFINDSFKLIVLQHAAESVGDPDAFSAELARVLAPEGVVLIFGFNPFSAWRPWLALQQRHRAGSTFRPQSAHRWETDLARHEIDVMQTRYLGSFLPRVVDTSPNIDDSTRWLRWLARFRGAYLLIARKQRSTLTPLRLRKPQRERGLPSPYLVPGTRRAQS